MQPTNVMTEDEFKTGFAELINEDPANLTRDYDNTNWTSIDHHGMLGWLHRSGVNTWDRRLHISRCKNVGYIMDTLRAMGNLQ